MPAELLLKAKTDQYPDNGRYWEHETPITARAGDFELRVYAQAGRMQFVRLILNRDNTYRVGQIVTARMDDLAASPDAVGLFQAVLDDALEGAVHRGE